MPGEVWTAILVLVLAGIAFLAVRSYVKKLRHGCCTGGDGPEKRPEGGGQPSGTLSLSTDLVHRRHDL